MIATYSDRLELMKLFIEKKASLDAIENAGWTALMIAANFNYINAAKLLIESGADATIKSNEDKKASDIATTKEMKKILIEAEKTK